jgi:hypothetical protein
VLANPFTAEEPSCESTNAAMIVVMFASMTVQNAL